MTNINNKLSIQQQVLEPNDLERSKLPFREKTELILLNQEGNVLTEDHGTYLMFPGGGIDNTDVSKKEAAIRELIEETKMTIDGDLHFLGDVAWRWFPEWANNTKRQRRYNKFQGEKVFHFVGKSKSVGNNVKSIEEGSWNSTVGIPIEECIKKLIDLANDDHPNTYPYRIAQVNSLRTLAIINGIKLQENSDSIINKLLSS